MWQTRSTSNRGFRYADKVGYSTSEGSGFDTWFRYLVSIRRLRRLLNPRDSVGYSTHETASATQPATGRLGAMGEGDLDQFGDEV
jgi:hypothetical protein